jgi:predicted dehydrogenase
MGILHSGIVNSLPDARVKAICEKETFLVKAARTLLPKTVAFYRDHVEMIQNEHIDAIFVTTPIATHVPLILDLTKENNDVSLFIEKPLAVFGEEARKGCDAVRGLSGVYMVGFQKRFSPIFRRAREFINEGALGELIFFRASSYSSDVLREGISWRFRKGTGGVLLDLAPHLLDILLWFFGEPVSVESFKARLYSRLVDDYAHAVMSYKSDLKGYMDACWSMRGYRLPEILIEVYGKKGTLTVTDDYLKIKLEGEVGREARVEKTFYKQSFQTSVPFLLADSEYTKEDQEFLACVERKVSPDTNFPEAAKVNELIDRINSASQVE